MFQTVQQFFDTCYSGNMTPSDFDEAVQYFGVENVLWRAHVSEIQPIVAWCCINGDVERLRHLVDLFGIDIDLSAQQNLPIQLAVRFGHLELLEYLIEENAQSVDPAANNNEAVRYAAFDGRLDIVRYLVEEAHKFSNVRVDVTAVHNDAIRWSSQNGYLEVVRYLVEEIPKLTGRYVDVTADHDYAFRWAAKHGHLPVVQYLFERSGQAVDPSAWDNYALRKAAKYGHIDVVRYLVDTIRHPVDVSDCDFDAFRRASENGHLSVVKFLVEEALLQSHEVLSIPIETFSSAFCWAAENGHFEIIRYFVDKYARSFHADAKNHQALRYATKNGHLDVVAYLLPKYPALTGSAIPHDIAGELVASAILEEQYAVLRYLGNSFDLKRIPIFKLDKMPMAQLMKVAFDAYGVKSVQHQKRESLVTDCKKVGLRNLSLLIDLHIIAPELAAKQRQKYLSSPACREASEAGTLETQTQLDALLKHDPIETQ